MQEINVEQIMKEIREDISEKGYTAAEMSFARALANMDSASIENAYNKSALRTKFHYLSTHYNNPIYFELPGNPIKAFFQRAVRRVLFFMIFPAFHFQNVFNEAVSDCIRQIKNYIDENDEVRHAPVRLTRAEEEIKRQQALLEKQQEQIQNLQARMSELTEQLQNKDR